MGAAERRAVLDSLHPSRLAVLLLIWTQHVVSRNLEMCRKFDEILEQLSALRPDVVLMQEVRVRDVTNDKHTVRVYRVCGIIPRYRKPSSRGRTSERHGTPVQ